MAFQVVSRRLVGLAASVTIGAMLATTAPVPASAQGFFDMLFGGFRRSVPQAAPSAYGDPRFDGRDNPDRDGRRGDIAGPGVAYCVRMCDGRHFPINYRGGSAVEICKSFCPAATTKVFSGGNIAGAVANDGKRYSEIPNAFVYRDKFVSDCTCDGKSPTGLVRQDVDDDPTLRPGDIVATNDGLMSYRGDNGRSAQFTPVANAAGLPAATRKQLSLTRVLPPRTVEEVGESGATGPVSRNVDQRGQASR